MFKFKSQFPNKYYEGCYFENGEFSTNSEPIANRLRGCRLFREGMIEEITKPVPAAIPATEQEELDLLSAKPEDQLTDVEKERLEELKKSLESKQEKEDEKLYKSLKKKGSKRTDEENALYEALTVKFETKE